jgi:hypothetical protein
MKGYKIDEQKFPRNPDKAASSSGKERKKIDELINLSDDKRFLNGNKRTQLLQYVEYFNDIVNYCTRLEKCSGYTHGYRTGRQLSIWHRISHSLGQPPGYPEGARLAIYLNQPRN